MGPPTELGRLCRRGICSYRPPASQPACLYASTSRFHSLDRLVRPAGPSMGFAGLRSNLSDTLKMLSAVATLPPSISVLGSVLVCVGECLIGGLTTDRSITPYTCFLLTISYTFGTEDFHFCHGKVRITM